MKPTFNCIVVVLLLSMGCNTEAKKVREEYVLEVKDLMSKYQPIANWDKKETFTYQYEEFLGRPLLFKGVVYDIIKSDTGYIAMIGNTAYREQNSYIARIAISPEQFVEFDKSLRAKALPVRGAFVFKANRVVPTDLKTIREASDDGSYIQLDYKSRVIVFQGQLIDYVLSETKIP